jgi:hypothetical protein
LSDPKLRAPFTANWPIAVTGDNLSPAHYLMAAALLSTAALMVMARRSARKQEAAA